MKYFWWMVFFFPTTSCSIQLYADFRYNTNHTCQVQSSQTVDRYSSQSPIQAYREKRIHYYARSNQYECGTCLLVTMYPSLLMKSFNDQLTYFEEDRPYPPKHPFTVMIADYHPHYTQELTLLVYSNVSISSPIILLKGIPIPCPHVFSPSSPLPRLVYLFIFQPKRPISTYDRLSPALLQESPSCSMYIYHHPYPLQQVSYFWNSSWNRMTANPNTSILQFPFPLLSREEDRPDAPPTTIFIPIRLKDRRGNQLLDVIEFILGTPLDPMFHHGYWFYSQKSFFAHYSSFSPTSPSPPPPSSKKKNKSNKQTKQQTKGGT